MAELADQVESGEVVNDAPIPDSGTDHGIEKRASEKPSGKPEKQTIRQALNNAVKVEQAKSDDKIRLHAKDGKFAGKDKPVEAQSAPAEIPTTIKDAQSKEPSTTAVGPPPGWSAESKAAFATLPDHIKADLAKREKEVSDGFKKYSDDTKKYQEIEQVLAPSRAVYQQHGLTNDAEAIKRLFSWEASLRNPQTRMQAFQGLARQYGIPLNSPQSQAPDAQGIPDQLRPVYDQFGQLTQQVSSIQGELQRSREEQVSKTLTDFAKDKPHFEKVRMRMGQLIQAGIVQPSDLDGAYQQACWADPDIRTALTKEQFDKQQAEAAKNQTNRAQSARQAAISPSTRSPTAPVANGAKPGKMTARESLMASIRELQDNRA